MRLRKVVIGWIKKNLRKGFITGREEKYLYDLVDIFENIFLPTVVFQFYKKQSNNFEEFLRKISRDQLDEFAPFLIEIFQKIRSELLLTTRDFSAHKIKILGDIHPDQTTKIRIDNRVIHKSNYTHEGFINDLINLIPVYSNFFPKHKIEKRYVHREYLPVDTRTELEKDIKEYYYNLGYIVPLLLLLRVTDANSENVLCRLPYPIFFDTECIFSPSSVGGRRYNIEFTGIVKSDDRHDISVLSGGIKPVSSYLKAYLCGNLERPMIKWRVRSKRKLYNIPYFKGLKVTPSGYGNEILKGFNDGYAIALRNEGPIFELITNSKTGTRLVVRATRAYRTLLCKYFYPQEYLKEKYSHIFFRRQLKNWPRVVDLQPNKFLLEFEVNTLSKGLIPIFYSRIDSKDVYTPDGIVVGRMKRTQLDQIRDHFKGFSSQKERNLKLLIASVNYSVN